jgi:hypothetical protein
MIQLFSFKGTLSKGLGSLFGSGRCLETEFDCVAKVSTDGHWERQPKPIQADKTGVLFMIKSVKKIVEDQEIFENNIYDNDDDPNNHIPNAETIRAIQETRAGIGIKEIKSIYDIFQKK